MNEVFAMANSALPPEIRDLTIAERVALIEQIWDSIFEDQAKFELTDVQKAELDRRLALRDASPDSRSDWADVKQRILEQS
jgi:putative addiction module component (TIGR02574 family)